ncbi:MAG: protein kinase [Planctomycetes bacterium]|nr:protein kinase [Planctomycetota bacterium]
MAARKSTRKSKAAPKEELAPPKNPAEASIMDKALESAVPVENVSFPDLGGFRLIQELGRSPRGVVYKARRLVEQDVVAVKIFRTETAQEPSFREQLQRNAEATFLLEHPALVRCLGQVQSEGRLLLVMEYARGEPVSRALQRNVRFLPPRAIEILLRCAEALQYADECKRHHGRLHPGDIIVHDDEVRMLGVGLGDRPGHTAWTVKDPHLFEPLVYVAPEAMPSRSFPESAEGRRAADLYALGALLYHMLTGVPPFRGSDEGSLNQERAALGAHVVRWPRGSERSLPSRALPLVQRLLSPEPADRGSYGQLIEGLRGALDEAHGRSAMAPTPPPPVLAPPEIGRKHSPSRGVALPSTPLLPSSAQVKAAAPAPGHRTGPHPRFRDDRRNERISTMMLVCATAVVFAFALVLATKTFLFSAPEETAALPPAPQAAPSLQPAPAPAAPEPAGSDEENRLARRLQNIEDLMKEDKVPYNSTLLRMIKEIADKAGTDSPTGIRAQVLIGEVNERLAGRGVKTDVAAGAAVPAPTTAEEGVYQKMLAHAKDLAGQQRFGAAMQVMRELPEGLKVAPFPERAEQQVRDFERQGQAAYADIEKQAADAEAAGDFAKARGILQTVPARFGLPKLSEAVETRVKVLNVAEEKALAAKEQQQMEKLREQDLAAFAIIARSAAEKAYGFSYKDAQDLVEAFAAQAKSPDVRKLAKDYAKLLREEGWFFDRCHTYLVEQIKQHPEGRSPLEVRNKKDPNAPALDLIDFGTFGLKFVARKGGATAATIKTWDSVSIDQPYQMLRFLMVDRDNAQEHLALAMISFHRQLKAERELAKATAPDATIKESAERMKGYAEKSLEDAVKADGAARDNMSAQRATMNQIRDIVLRADPGAEK